MLARFICHDAGMLSTVVCQEIPGYCAIVETIVHKCPFNDQGGRAAGDGFAVLLPGTNAPAADVSLQRVRDVIRKNDAHETKIPIHISMGVSTADKTERLTAALQEADSNMFGEKRRH